MLCVRKKNSWGSVKILADTTFNIIYIQLGKIKSYKVGSLDFSKASYLFKHWIINMQFLP